ncbi:PA2169 family four-helix-bundle protein [Pontibacter diazotrophicus]|uniref:PA2169 family four-helix-bundle protein n=1 Tax=Pontibacter diazotrophicus TaxID=1400979 RepID=A0A3D8LIQ9_9BACT|nr:PA2169 family four-helix-bundle protein [Pontibacter diazotrophicus]RDV17134.1 PA2169 family four-helix-bundle protein [Pontibacter diazotrophicus]
MQNNNEKTIDVLQELNQFVNDRIEGYKHASEATKNPAHQSFYNDLINESNQFSNQINRTISKYGGERQESTTTKGKIFRGWMDVKATVTGSDEEAIIESNLYGEEWAQKAYNDALDQKGELPENIVQMVEKQKQSSLATCEKLRQMKETVD